MDTHEATVRTGQMLKKAHVCMYIIVHVHVVVMANIALGWCTFYKWLRTGGDGGVVKGCAAQVHLTVLDYEHTAVLCGGELSSLSSLVAMDRL